MNQPQQKNGLLRRITGQSDIVLAVGVIAILAVMVIPLPAGFLDILLAINITFALVVLMISLYLNEPLDFSVFPSMLLVMTLFRLSLNVASTRLILGDAYAGNVISAFGNFVVKGNYVVGFVIFFILVIIQFVVITKGAGRIAEVAARFTLDAMPGKQMAIDADLNAGLIDEVEARKRREKIASEADFYGAMDGASKFVRGDAIAGLIITVINIIGGFIIGMVQKNMGFSDALQTYTLLTVGDGLVSQIPALVLSTSAGLIVTRASSETNLGQDLSAQLLKQPRALSIVAGALFMFGITPGLPTLPFLILAGLSAIVARGVYQAKKEEAAAELVGEKEELEDEEENITRYLHVDPLEIEIGYGLISLVDEEQGGDLLTRITAIRKQCAIELGIVIPPIRIRDNISLNPEEYIIKIRGADVAKGEIYMNRMMALAGGENKIDIEGIDTVDPAFGLPAVWLQETQREIAEKKGYTIVEPGAVMATHLKEVLKQHAFEIMSRQDVNDLIENVKKENGALVEELIPNMLNTGQVQKVLQNLLRERVPIRDMATILETLADAASLTKETDVLTEFVRSALLKIISKPFIDNQNVINSLILEPGLENYLSNNLEHNQKIGLNLPPDHLKKLYDNIREEIDKMNIAGYTPLLLCSPTIRSYLQKILEMAFPQLSVLSYNEVPGDVNIQSVGVIRLKQ
ncbi:MAG TPA: flagellar biosynthesis protein FlhA [Bacteroidetes bacterium]|nr:flagellar biosynthesis protein FlhA [Bacteroidota bacterium]